MIVIPLNRTNYTEMKKTQHNGIYSKQGMILVSASEMAKQTFEIENRHEDRH